MSVYERLGIRPVINADATLTRLGGSLMAPEVSEAMREASGSFVDMHELQKVVGQRIAELTNNQAAYVTPGAAAGLVLAALAAMNGGDLLEIARQIEDGGTSKDEVIMQRAHRIPYDPAITLAGGTIVEVGNRLQTFDWELEAAFTPRTAMVFYVAGEHLAFGALPLEDVIRIAHAHDVPVLVDAAAQLPPTENLWHFTRDLGADLVVFSGGKDFHGPQASGLLVGTQRMIDAVTVNGSPNQRLARPMKVGKEEMIGLLTSIERYMQVDWRERVASYEETVAHWVDRLNSVPGLTAERVFPNEAGQPTPRCRLRFSPDMELTSADVVKQLWDGNPRIAVAADGPGAISFTPELLRAGEENVLLGRLLSLASTPVAAD